MDGNSLNIAVTDQLAAVFSHAPPPAGGKSQELQEIRQWFNLHGDLQGISCRELLTRLLNRKGSAGLNL